MTSDTHMGSHPVAMPQHIISRTHRICTITQADALSFHMAHDMKEVIEFYEHIEYGRMCAAKYINPHTHTQKGQNKQTTNT